MVPSDNDFEFAFSKFMDNADDVVSFSKLPQPFGFSIDYTDGGMNLRSYYPDFVAVDTEGMHWPIETQGRRDGRGGSQGFGCPELVRECDRAY